MQRVGCLPIYGHTELVRRLRRYPALLDAMTSQSPALRSDDSPTFCQASQTVTMQPQRNCTDPPGPIFNFHKKGILAGFSQSNVLRYAPMILQPTERAKPSWFKPQLPAAKWPSQDADHNTSRTMLMFFLFP